jgi:CubicO group peptidase (beta-lactamase class C family)
MTFARRPLPIRSHRLLFAFLAAAVQTGPAAAQTRTAAPDLKGFDEAVTALMTEFHVPGLGVGIIKDGQVVLAKGYGFRDVEAKTPVTPRTVFAIGSNSKSFTATLLAMLVDEKKLEWDKPVRTWLPDFELKDPYATREMTPRDLVSHLSGLPRHDVLWYGRSFTREQLYQRLKYLEPSTSFRNYFQYQNLMFMTAGVLAERITGQTWEQLVQSRIFTPLGMTRANTSTNDLPKADDFSWAYDYRNGQVVKVPYRNLDPVGAAGSINASVEDMLKYIQFRMNFGRAGDKQLVSARQDSIMQTSRSVIPGGWSFQNSPEVGPDTYGLALAVSNYRGSRLIMHGGGIDGFISQMAWLPNEKIGLVVLSNTTNSGGGGNPVPNALTFHILDRMLGLPKIDWQGRARAQSQRGDSIQKARRAQDLKDRVAGTSPSHPLEAFAGKYEHPAYGTLEIRCGTSSLEAILDHLQAPLSHVHYDVFEIPPGTPSAGAMQNVRFAFEMDGKGAINSVSVRLEPSVAPIEFVRARQ